MGTDFLYKAVEETEKLKTKDFTGTSRMWKMIALPLIYAILSIARSLKERQE